MRPPAIDRRTVLRGAGAAIALPFLDAMLPRGLTRAAAAAVAESERVARVAFVFFPNGVNTAEWLPTADAAGLWVPSRTLAPLEGFRDRITVYTGLRHRNAEANGDGPGDHARSAATRRVTMTVTLTTTIAMMSASTTVLSSRLIRTQAR